MNKENIIQAAEPLAIDHGPGNNRVGEICAANEARFDQAYYDEPLTTYLVGGWDRDPLEELLRFYAPTCSVPRRFHYKEFRHADEFWSDDGNEDIRAIGAEFGRVRNAETREVHLRVPNKGLTVTLDRDESERGVFDEQAEVVRLRRRLLRNELRRAITLLSAAAVNQAFTWDTSAGKDPDQDIATQLLTAENLSGVRPNRAGYGSVAWAKRVLAHRAQNSAGGFASASMTPEQIGAFLGVESIATSDARFRGASALTAMVNNLVLMFQALEGATKDDPSNIKRFVSHVDSGGLGAVYRREVGPKLVELTVEHYSVPVITSTLGIRKATIS